MSNYHNRKWIMNEIHDHLEESIDYFEPNQIVGIFLQGSQNYGLDTPTSDVDTKLVVLPSFKDIALNCKPVSTTHVRENQAHTDWKDLRLMLNTFRKQNFNFLEILFTPYYFISYRYQDEWQKLVNGREAIAHYSPYAAIKSMKGIAREKFHAMEHRYPAKVEIIDTWGYDPKQLMHLLRVHEYIQRYIAGEPYADCLIPANPDYLRQVKDYKNPKYALDKARIVAETAMESIETMCDDYLYNKNPNLVDQEVDALLDEVQCNIMWKMMEAELNDDKRNYFYNGKL